MTYDIKVSSLVRESLNGLLIDPFERTITKINILPTLLGIYDAIHADIFENYYVNRSNDYIYLDGNGLTGTYPENQDHQAFFLLSTRSEMFAGYGLILGTDEQGLSIDAEPSIEDLESIVSFIS